MCAKSYKMKTPQPNTGAQAGDRTGSGPESRYGGTIWEERDWVGNCDQKSYIKNLSKV